MKTPHSFLQIAIFLFIAFCTLPGPALAQSTHTSLERSDYRGTHFWLCFPQNARSENGSKFDPQLLIAGDPGTLATIAYLNQIVKIELDSSGYAMMHVDSSLQILGREVTRKCGIEVTTSRAVNVFAISHRRASTDSYAAIPVNELGMKYRSVGYASPLNVDNVFHTQVDIIATNDSTQVRITDLAGITHATQVRMSDLSGVTSIDGFVSLNRGEVYQLQDSGLHPGEMTGYEITSSKPVAFFTGHACAQVPYNVSFCNTLIEEEPPAEDWGKKFILPTLEGKDHYTIRVVADSDETEVTLAGKHVAMLGAGEYYETDELDQPALLITSKPTIVAEYGQSSTADSVQVGDPFMMLITPVDNYLTRAEIGVPYFNASAIAAYGNEGLANLPDPTLRRFTRISMHNGNRKDPLPLRKGMVLNYNTIKTDTGVVQIVEEDTLAEVVRVQSSKVSSPEVRNESVGHGIRWVEVPDVRPKEASTAGWINYVVLTGSADIVGSIRMDGAMPERAHYTMKSIDGAPYVMVQFRVAPGPHHFSADSPFGIYSYGFGKGEDNFDSYGTGAGQLLKITDR